MAAVALQLLCLFVSRIDNPTYKKAEIKRLVYQLYGLPTAEIAIVKGTVNE